MTSLPEEFRPDEILLEGFMQPTGMGARQFAHSIRVFQPAASSTWGRSTALVARS